MQKKVFLVCQIRRKIEDWQIDRYSFQTCKGCEKNWEIFENLPTKVSDQLRSKLQVSLKFLPPVKFGLLTPGDTKKT